VAAIRVAVAVIQAGEAVLPLLARFPPAPPATLVPPGALPPAVGVARPLVVFGFVTVPVIPVPVVPVPAARVPVVPVPVVPGEPARAVSTLAADVIEPDAVVLAPALPLATVAPAGADVDVLLLPLHAASRSTTASSATGVYLSGSFVADISGIPLHRAASACMRAWWVPLRRGG
jgi:hypothetical protein